MLSVLSNVACGHEHIGTRRGAGRARRGPGIAPSAAHFVHTTRDDHVQRPLSCVFGTVVPTMGILRATAAATHQRTKARQTIIAFLTHQAHVQQN